MFMYFPDNYPWSMAVLLTLNTGGVMSDIDEACAALKPVAGANDAVANELWFQNWLKIAERAEAQAETDAAAGRRYSSARKYLRAAVYYMAGERQMPASDAQRGRAYQKLLDCFAKGIADDGATVERVEVPYRDTTLPALFVPAAGDRAGPVPAVVHMDGLDVMKEFIYLAGVPRELARRGMATLVLDHPGVGEALRQRDLTLYPETEVPAGAAIDWLERRDGIDGERIAIMAISLGGYYAPRAAAFEKRFAACVAWGAQWDYGVVTEGRMGGDASELSVSNWRTTCSGCSAPTIWTTCWQRRGG